MTARDPATEPDRPRPGIPAWVAWLAYGFSRGGPESARDSCPPPLKRWATQQSMVICRIGVGGALEAGR